MCPKNSILFIKAPIVHLQNPKADTDKGIYHTQILGIVEILLQCRVTELIQGLGDSSGNAGS